MKEKFDGNREAIAALTALAATGFTFMTLEILFLRELQITLGGTLYASSAMLASVMLGLFLGSQLFGRLSRGAADIGAVFLRLELALAAAALAVLPALRALGPVEPWALRFALSFAVVLVPSMLAGGELPVALQFLEPRIASGQTGFYAGLAYGADTLGALAGALATPFFLLPRLGALRSAGVAAAAEAAGALLFWSLARTSRRAGGFAAAAALLAAAAAVAGDPGAALDLRSAGWARDDGLAELRLARVEDSPYQRIEVLSNEGDPRALEPWTVMLLDGTVQAAVPFPPAFRESALIGLLSHPRPERVLVIGCGDGDLLAALLTDPRVFSLDHVELDPAVVRTARLHLPEAARTPAGLAWDDPRVRLHFADGRQFLRESAASYDFILADLPHAAHEGAAAFYSAEFFALARSRLNPGGLLMTHVYRPDEDAPGGRARALAALLIAGTTARRAFPEVRLLSPWLDPASAEDAWPVHWLLASDRPIGAAEGPARGRLAALAPRPRWLTPANYRAALASAVDPAIYPGWPVSTDDWPAILFPERWAKLEPARSSRT